MSKDGVHHETIDLTGDSPSSSPRKNIVGVTSSASAPSLSSPKKRKRKATSNSFKGVQRFRRRRRKATDNNSGLPSAPSIPHVSSSSSGNVDNNDASGSSSLPLALSMEALDRELALGLQQEATGSAMNPWGFDVRSSADRRRRPLPDLVRVDDRVFRRFQNYISRNHHQHRRYRRYQFRRGVNSPTFRPVTRGDHQRCARNHHHHHQYMGNVDIDRMDYEQLSAFCEQLGEVKERGLSPIRVDQLPQFVYKGHGNEKSCSVCISDFEEGENLRALPCLHSFHKDCIDPWLVNKAVCPVCQFDVQQSLTS